MASTLAALPASGSTSWFTWAQALHAAVAAAQTDILAKADTSTLTESVQDIVGGFVKAGTNVTVAYDDANNTFTINSTASGSSSSGTGTDPEVVRDTIAAALVAGSGVQITADDAADTITITVSGITAAKVTDASTVGRSVLTAADASTARTVLGAAATTAATSSAAGLMSSADKAKLDGVATGATANSTISSITGLPAALDAKASLAALLLWVAANPEAMPFTGATYDTNNAWVSASVTWPDGATGTYTGTASTVAVGLCDKWTITHVLAGTTTTTYTQPTITRNSAGYATTRPAITVA